MLTEDLASRFARIALSHVEREYPTKIAHAMTGPEDVGTPSQLYPIFHGSYDWHSCVHGYWLLAYLLQRFPEMEPAADIRALFGRKLTADNIAGECAYLSRPSSRGFERPYGWAWTLKLCATLRGTAWEEATAPLGVLVEQKFRDFLPKATYPVRVGTHFNTAFALRLAADYADAEFLALLRDTARRWYGEDRDAPAWGEPSGDDFLSSTLIEAEAMRRLLPPEEFAPWCRAFLPRLAQQEPATLFTPATVSDRSDGKIAHLDGLNLSRAWCWRNLGQKKVAQRHLEAGLPHVAGDYMGEHWLASFAVLALEG
ncbi:DUF2891 domain-containing protein [Pseudoroseomonas cervicalis]|uniref:DUF2891 domain-containing protein n=1 Tax=Teichococcus cervicalis TaxID=204525 RepID=UPI0022F19B72|nr:DUF2891 domain-containing protein [Pseudoroseomonas cervicalis]WBV42510.1 DUF2891 domain-containing protein [Pseudoroseomonas cervicalis]